MKSISLENTVNETKIRIKRVVLDADNPNSLTFYMDDVWPFKADQAYEITGEKHIQLFLLVCSGTKSPAEALQELQDGKHGQGVGVGNNIMTWIHATPLAMLLKYPPDKHNC